MKKTIFYYFLIVLMLFAFVSCSPETNSSSDNLLPGEVTPPAESKRVEASDEELSKAYSILSQIDAHSDGRTETEYTCSEKYGYTFDNGDTFSFSMESDNSGNVKITANGKLSKLTIDSSAYEISNYTLTYADGTYTESGKFLKDNVEVTKEEAASFFNSLSFRYKTIEGASVKYERKMTDKFTFLKDGVKKDGSSLMFMSTDGDSEIEIFDITYGEDRVQNKVSVKNNGSGDVSVTVDYLALNGKFFNAASIKKLLKMQESEY